MKITLELFEDCSSYDIDDLSSAHWQLMINGKEIGQLKTYEEIHKHLDILLDIEEALTPKK